MTFVVAAVLFGFWSRISAAGTAGPPRGACAGDRDRLLRDRVTHHALHTPLMSVTNAISGIIVVAPCAADRPPRRRRHCAGVCAAILLAAHQRSRWFFAVTRRMLAMFSWQPEPASWKKLWNGFHVQDRNCRHGGVHHRGLCCSSWRWPDCPGYMRTSKAGNTFGIAGMAVALIATIALAVNRSISPLAWGCPSAPCSSAQRSGCGVPAVEMTGMPERRRCHSFVGLAMCWSAGTLPRRRERPEQPRSA